MIRWQYLCLEVSENWGLRDWRDRLIQLGSDGWELVTVMPKSEKGQAKNLAIFKRAA